MGKAIKSNAQLRTGNFNQKTSEIYTDFSLMTSNQKLHQKYCKSHWL
ncbi:hypothetical protein [Winogradskyella sp. UBA3174]